MLMYENKTYKVIVGEDQKYNVINKNTGVIEGVTEILPKAMMMAEEYLSVAELFLAKVANQPEEGVPTNVVSIGTKSKDRTE